MSNCDFLIKCLKLLQECSIEPYFYFEEDKVRITINTNDLFFWGCADEEEVTPENFHILEESYNDLKALGEYEYLYTYVLFACRINKMRPQGAAYPTSSNVFPLINACGPEREIGLGNPCEVNCGNRRMRVYSDFLYDLFQDARDKQGKTTLTHFKNMNGEDIVFEAMYLPNGDLSINDGEAIIKKENLKEQFLTWLNKKIQTGA